MSDAQTHLAEMLAHYGSDINRWPNEFRHIGLEALEHSSLAALITEEKNFEQLLDLRRTTATPHDLVQRIIKASYARRQPIMAAGWFSGLLGEVRPAALAAMLALGFLIGFDMVPAVHSTGVNIVQSSADDEGAIL